MQVDVGLRTNTLGLRGKPYIIYHQVIADRPYSTINVQIRVEDPATTKMVIMARHKKMPIVKKCDFVKIVSEIEPTDDNIFKDWFITTDQVRNRTGEWYFGVASIGQYFI